MVPQSGGTARAHRVAVATLSTSRHHGDSPHCVARGFPYHARGPHDHSSDARAPAFSNQGRPVRPCRRVAHARDLLRARNVSGTYSKYGSRHRGRIPGRPRPHLACRSGGSAGARSEEHTSELQSLAYLVCRLLLEKKKKIKKQK